MRAVVITRPGGPEVLELREVPTPEPGPDELLVRVRASALNRADLLQREGRYPPPPGAPADIPGLEFAGEVVRAGARVSLWRPGDRVFGLVAGGAHAEYVVSHERAVAAVPASMSWRDAGAVPEAFVTAHDALVTQAATRPGDVVLVHAVGSGVGLAAVQVARLLGARAFGSARTPDKIERARALGMEDGIALGGGVDALAPRVAEWTGGRGADVVIDLLGGPYVAASVASLAYRGRLVLVGTIAGRRSELDLGAVMQRRATIRGTLLRSRPIEEKIAATRLFAAEVLPALAAGVVRATVDSVFDLSDVRAAHERLAGNATFGKVVLTVAAD
ncbi:MAG TPA: NAD(P)H-quinone oxidoreductase [Gemmatimonadaceae bacterium]|nr:NAD(P)H-quinone oxidoreductase [Gemmatimonadaceae bacterium]